MSGRAATAQRQPTPVAPGVRPSLRIARLDPRQQVPVRQRAGVLFRPVTIAIAAIVVSLLAVVVGNMLLASGQLQLEQLQAKLAAKESSYALRLEKFTEATSPKAATTYEKEQGLVQPSLVLPIPAASLEHRLAPPVFSSAPCCALTPGR